MTIVEQNSKKVYRVTVGTAGYLPDDYQDYDTLTDAKAAISDTISEHRGVRKYKRHEGLTGLRKSHLVHAGEYGVDVGFLIDDYGDELYIHLAYVREDL